MNNLKLIVAIVLFLLIKGTHMDAAQNFPTRYELEALMKEKNQSRSTEQNRED